MEDGNGFVEGKKRFQLCFVRNSPRWKSRRRVIPQNENPAPTGSYPSAASAIPDVLADRVHAVVDPIVSSIEHIRAGRLRPLAVTTAIRSEALPDVPVMADFLPGYEASAWAGFGAPKNTSVQVIDKLNKEINAGLADAKIKARLADLGGMMLPGSPTDFRKLIADETEKWGNVIRTLNIKAE